MALEASTSAKVRHRLDAWKRQLIDLTRRNRLLNYRPTKSSTIEVVDELPQAVLKQLIDGLTFQFDPRPQKEPDEETDRDKQGFGFGTPRELPNLPSPLSAERDHRGGLEITRTTGRDLADYHRDDRLQTKHVEKQLDGKLLHIYRTAQGALEEQGVNTLFLALGMLEWYESKDSDQVNRAPLLMIPAWLTRQDASSRFVLQRGDDEPLLNPAIVELLHLNFGITLPELPVLSDDLDTDRIFFRVKEAVAGFSRWRVTSDIALGLFDFRKFVMYKDLERYPGKFAEHSVIQSMCGESKGSSLAELPQDVTNADLDDEMSPWSTIQVVDADSSQQRAMLAVRRGHHLVIEGPPGTGKSQTITNVIADALADGRSVLFVSEKMAALEVVKTRLESAGLGDFCLELHSHHTKKTEFVRDLARTLDAATPDTPSFAKELRDLQRLTVKLKQYVTALHEPFGELGLTPFQAIAHLTEVEHSPVVRVDLASFLELSASEYDATVERLTALVRALSEIDAPDEHPLRGCRISETTRTTQRDLEAATGDSVRAVHSLVEEAHAFSEHMGFQSAETLGDVQLTLSGAEVVARSPGAELSVLQNPKWNELSSDVNGLLATGRECSELHDRTKSRFRSEILKEQLGPTLDAYENHLKSVLRFLKPSFWKHRSYLRSYRLPGYTPERSDGFVSDLREAEKCRERLSELCQQEVMGRDLFGSRWEGEASDWDDLAAFAEWVVEVRQYALKAVLGVKGFQLAAEASMDPDEARRRSARLSEALNDANEAVNRLIDVGKFGELSELELGASTRLPALLTRVEEIDRGQDKLRSWALYRAAREQCDKDVSAHFITRALADRLAPDALVPAFTRAFLEAWLDAVCRERPTLGEFRASDHEAKIHEFRELDAASHRIARIRTRQQLLARRGQELLKPEYSDQLQRVQREAKKRSRILPIRRLLRQAPDIITLIKPCLMMSPLSVAWYLDPEVLHFDLLVFDEASQIPPSDSVGSIMRANQIVVVGDSKQLPPTNFFAAQLDSEDEVEEEEELLEDLESVLDEAATSGVPRVRLKWHYRSEHESLIRFSNEEYYADDPLYTFPHAATDRSELGLQFEYVEDGMYEGRGVNTVEAQRVAQAVVHHVEECPELTLGIGTFGMGQQTRILDELDEHRRSKPSIEFFFQREGEEKFFVKNLENIQGDDRDVIFLSVTYGPGSDGRIRRNFGPLNNAGGWRRLNVITTRAKKRMTVFSSMRADEIDVSGGIARGALDLQRFLKYAETGQYPTAKVPGPEPGSPFERAVIHELEARGYSVVPQVGEAGYRIDIGVLDPDLPGRFCCGIECDGASYHSALTVRDRDRLRELVLENRGWQIHRVWSTDWFHDRKGQIERLLRLIEKSRRHAREGRQREIRHPKIVVPDIPESLPLEGSWEPPAADPPEVSEIPVKPYRFARPDTVRSSERFYEASLATLGEACERILKTEGPIHREELGRRVAEFWGLHRLGSRIQHKVNNALRQLGQKGRIELRGDFVWDPSMKEPPVRSRAIDGVTFRAEHISPEEVAAAIRLLLFHRAPLLQAKIAPEASRILGFRRTGKHLQALMDETIRRLIDAGELEAGGFGIRLHTDPGSSHGSQAPATVSTESAKDSASSDLSRPYLQASIAELEALVQSFPSDRVMLGRVLQELSFRTTARARELGEQIRQRLG